MRSTLKHSHNYVDMRIAFTSIFIIDRLNSFIHLRLMCEHSKIKFAISLLLAFKSTVIASFGGSSSVFTG